MHKKRALWLIVLVVMMGIVLQASHVENEESLQNTTDVIAEEWAVPVAEEECPILRWAMATAGNLILQLPLKQTGKFCLDVSLKQLQLPKDECLLFKQLVTLANNLLAESWPVTVMPFGATSTTGIEYYTLQLVSDDSVMLVWLPEGLRHAFATVISLVRSGWAAANAVDDLFELLQKRPELGTAYNFYKKTGTLGGREDRLLYYLAKLGGLTEDDIVVGDLYLDDHCFPVASQAHPYIFIKKDRMGDVQAVLQLAPE